MKLIQRLLNLLFPPRCILCRKILSDEETDLCRKCRSEAPDFPACPAKMHPSGKTRLHFLDSCTAVWYYEGNVRGSILRYKFYHAAHYSGAFGRLMAMKITKEHPEGFDLLTWVPVSGRRKWSRGYDQSELLAKAVGQEIGLQPSRLLKKIRHNKPQSGMTADRRKANVLGAYQCIQEELTGKRILLIDDVFTTGSTSEECARVLLTCGAKEVHCAVIAAAQKHGTTN